MLSRSDRGGGALHGAQDANMRSAAAEIAREFLLDLLVAGVLGLGEKCRRLHDHAVDAIAALHGLLVDKGLLDGMRLLRRAEPLQRDDLLVGDRRDGDAAGT